jgi:RNA-binding protein
MRQLTNTQKQFLRRAAHDLRPTVQIGKNGLTEEIYAALEHELDAHELIKLKFMDFRDEKQALAETIAERTNGVLIGIIGNVAILYRQQADLEKRRIRLPA